MAQMKLTLKLNVYKPSHYKKVKFILGVLIKKNQHAGNKCES